MECSTILSLVSEMSLMRVGGNKNKLKQNGVLSNVHGYNHCMPYGNVSFVMRLLPLEPGNVMKEWAWATAAKQSAIKMGSNMIRE